MLRKINLSRAVRTMQELFPEEYNFYPRSWILPEEYQLFSTQVQNRPVNKGTRTHCNVSTTLNSIMITSFGNQLS